MKILKFLTILFLFPLASCSDKFPVDKRYWTPEDYRAVLFEIEYETTIDEQYPRLSDPETAEVIKKLVDAENYKVMLDDPELGLNFKNEIAQEFFDHYRNMSKLYHVTDRQDKYVYPEEVAEIEKFGLGLQIIYFTLGNERIRQESDSPESTEVKQVIRQNEQTAIRNFNIYFEHIKDEEHFSSSAALLAEGVTIHFFKLIEAFPDADYSSMAGKASALLEKTQEPALKDALSSLLTKIDSVKKPA
jgi:hypothetical protein